MPITNIKLSNFKSFEEINVDLSNFNVLIGKNASGKSNFVQIFRFLKDIANHNMETAISKQGGIEYLKNIQLGSSRKFSLKISSNKEFKFPISREEGNILTKINETEYELVFQFTETKFGYKIAKEHVKFFCDFHELLSDDNDDRVILISESNEGDLIGKGNIELSNICGKISINLGKTELEIDSDDIIPRTVLNLIEGITKENSVISLLDTPLAGLPVPWISIFNDVAIYDFDPKSSKSTTKHTVNKLKENGENLSFILQNIKNDKDDERKFLNLLKDLLPFVDNVNVECFFDNQLIFLLKEKYFKKDLPASHISDGTVNIIDLILALYFEKERFIIIEEPERNVHPHLLSKIVKMMQESSKNKQIIITTHNPEVLKYSNNDNIYYISRDKKGFSTISKPNDTEEIKSFLKDIGIEELYVDNMLGE